MGTLFSIMPFAGALDEIDEIIGEAAAACGLEYVRGDRRYTPGGVVQEILQEIRRADVVVADITGNNPNVFYELGIAHHLKGPGRVVIIAQASTGSPYDVQQFDQLIYEHNASGRQRLRKLLPEYVRAAARPRADFEAWSVVRGRLPRTRMIVRDLVSLVDGAKDLSGVTIRCQAGLGSLAISDREPPNPDVEYQACLLAERDALRNALVRGARLLAILNPPRRFVETGEPRHLLARFHRLLGLLGGESDALDGDSVQADLAAIRNCSFVINPIPTPHQIIVGDRVAYEGMKRGLAHGFAMTHVETDQDEVGALIREFDTLFDASRAAMCRSHPPDGRFAQQLRECLEEATASMTVG